MLLFLSLALLVACFSDIHYCYCLGYCSYSKETIAVPIHWPKGLVLTNPHLTEVSSGSPCSVMPTLHDGSILHYQPCISIAYTPKVCRIMAFGLHLGDLGCYFTYFWGPGTLYLLLVAPQLGLCKQLRRLGSMIGFRHESRGDFSVYRETQNPKL